MSSIDNSTTGPVSPKGNRANRETGKVQPLALVLVLLILCIAGGAFWSYRTAQAPKMARDGSEADIRLSDSTRRALQGLRSPVEIRFYSLLGKKSNPDSLRAFSARVDRLLAGYEREADGKIILTNYNSLSVEDLDAASSDGLRVFNLDKGDPSYLGLSVVRDDRKESLPRITPEWEQALEADLTRAILRVSGASSIADQLTSTTRAESEVVAAVKRAIPNVDSIPVDQGRQVLREQALNDMKAAVTGMQTQIQEARQRFSEAQDTKSESGQEAAMKQVREAQAAQAEKIQEISARLDAQITALERLKGVSPNDH